MNVTVVAILSVALLLSVASVIQDRQFRDFTPHEKFMGLYVIAVASWPLMWTYLFGPMLWKPAKASGAFYPSCWYVPALAMGLGYFAHTALHGRSRIDLAALLQFSLLAISLVIFVYSHPTLRHFVHLSSMAVLLLPTLVKPSRIRMDAIGWGCRISLIVVVASVWLSTLVISDDSVGSCRLDKCSIAGQVITSPFSSNGNLLGIAVALLMPFAVYRQPFYRAAFIVLSVGLIADLAGSRTAEAAIAVTVTVMILVWALPALRRLILITGLAGALVVSLIPAVIPFSDEQFTFRAVLWNDARELIGHDLILGSGPFEWTRFGESSIFDANYSPHNGWLDAVLAIGLSGVVIMVIAIALKVYLSRTEEADLLLLYFANVLILSILEAIYVPYNLLIVPFACVLPFLSFGIGRHSSSDDGVKAAGEQAGDVVPMSAKGRDEWTS